MDIETLRDYCLSKPGTTESFPFDEQTLVFKVMNKMYALIGLERIPPSVNLKCDSVSTKVTLVLRKPYNRRGC